MNCASRSISQYSRTPWRSYTSNLMPRSRLAVDGDSACAIRADGVFQCWGNSTVLGEPFEPTSPPDGTDFHPTSPTRVLDSRLPDVGFSGMVAAGAPRALGVAGGDSVAGVPATASAVVLNVQRRYNAEGITQFNIVPGLLGIILQMTMVMMTSFAVTRERIHQICEGICQAHGATVAIDYDSNYPVTFNDPDEAVFASDVAAVVAGEAQVHRAIPPVMGGEDFSYMLEARPGAFIFIGNGETANLHHPAYDFNDEVIPHGVSYWVRLAETALAA